MSLSGDDVVMIRLYDGCGCVHGFHLVCVVLLDWLSTYMSLVTSEVFYGVTYSCRLVLITGSQPSQWLHAS